MCPDLGFDRSHIFFKHTHAAALLQVNFSIILLRTPAGASLGTGKLEDVLTV